METSNKWHKLKNESIYPFHKFQGNAPFLQSLVGLFLFCLFLGMFTELWKATVSFVTSVCLSVSMELLSSQGTDFHESWCLTIFWKSVKKIHVLFKSDKKNGTLHEDKCAFLIISWSGLLILRNASERSCRENQKHFISSIFFPENWAFWFGHVHRMPDNSMVKKVYEWSPALTKSLGRSKNRWEDDVKSDITRMQIKNWKDCIRNRTKWKKLVEKAKTSLKL